MNLVCVATSYVRECEQELFTAFTRQLRSLRDASGVWPNCHEIAYVLEKRKQANIELGVPTTFEHIQLFDIQHQRQVTFTVMRSMALVLPCELYQINMLSWCNTT